MGPPRLFDRQQNMVKILIYFFENIAQRRRDFETVIYRKAQAICLALSVIWILPNNYNLQIVPIAKFKSSKNKLFWWITVVVLVLKI